MVTFIFDFAYTGYERSEIRTINNRHFNMEVFLIILNFEFFPPPIFKKFVSDYQI
jgi:hypothetical protein